MNKTQFLTPQDKFILVDKIKGGSEEAESVLYNEIDRLESRIRTLELGLEQAVSAMNSKTNIEPKRMGKGTKYAKLNG